MAVYRSLAQFNKQCIGYTNTFRRSMAAGTVAAANVTKKSVIEAAQRRGWPTTRGKRSRPVVSVGYRLAVQHENPTALVQLRNGFLYERGSYKHPEGWDIQPKRVSARRARNAAARGQTLSQRSAVMTPYGVFARVHHPAVRGRPFWHAGIEAARPPVRKAFATATRESLIRTFR